MKKQLLQTLLLFMLFPLLATAQNSGKKSILYGRVANRFTKAPIEDAKVYLLDSDSAVLDSTLSNMVYDSYRGSYEFSIYRPRLYYLRFVHPGYESVTVPCEVKKLRKSGGDIKIRKVTYMQRDFVQSSEENADTLDEVKVVATKVKFYHRGDTLVYDADAFNLPEGSMLDDLIRQLPGAELKDNGVILVNGRQVDVLLLNGKDFITSDNRLMLDNLPYYMVKELKVYERTAPALFENPMYKQYVMDVAMKRQYVTGWIANAEGGCGTSDSYMGRVFGLRMTENSNLFVYANVNNLNDYSKPGTRGDWTPNSSTSGTITNRRAGLNYTIDGSGTFKGNGNLDVSHNDNTQDGRSNTTNFLSGGNTYQNAFRSSRTCGWNIVTDHSLRFNMESSYRVSLMPHFEYHKNKGRSRYVSALFSEDMTDLYGKDLLDSISSPDPDGLIRRMAINRLMTSNLDEGDNLSGRLSINQGYKVSNIVYSLNARYAYFGNWNENFSHYRLDYPASAFTDYRNKYTDASVEKHDFNVFADARIAFDTETNLNISYMYSSVWTNSNTSYYLLNKLEGWGADSENRLGSLPSDYELLSAMDIDNTNDYKQRNQRHTVRAIFSKNILSGENTYEIRMELPFHLGIYDLDYRRAGNLYTPHKEKFYFEPYANFVVRNKRSRADITYNCYRSIPSLLNDVMYNTSDPLNIYVGNSSLKAAYMHKLNFSYRKTLSGQRMYNVGVSGGLTQNKETMSYVYDKSTGVRTFTPCTVNGTWNAGAKLGWSLPLDKKKLWTFNSNTSVNYWNSVDMVGVDDASETIVATEKMRNGNLYVDETLRLNYRPSSKYDFGLKCNFHYLNSNNENKDIDVLNAYDFDYGVTAKVDLPLDLQVSTDLTMYSRRGYNDRSMNTDDLIWNARLSKRFMNGNLVVMLDGFDILGNLSSTYRKVSATGIVESFNRSIHRYALMHVVYKFNKKKK